MDIDSEITREDANEAIKAFPTSPTGNRRGDHLPHILDRTFFEKGHGISKARIFGRVLRSLGNDRGTQGEALLDAGHFKQCAFIIMKIQDELRFPDQRMNFAAKGIVDELCSILL